MWEAKTEENSKGNDIEASEILLLIHVLRDPNTLAPASFQTVLLLTVFPSCFLLGFHFLVFLYFNGRQE